MNATKTPRANEQLKIYHRTILHALLTTVEEGDKWDQKIKMMQWGINNTVNAATGKTAHHMLIVKSTATARKFEPKYRGPYIIIHYC